MAVAPLTKARNFEKRYGAYVSKEERPAFHITPPVGWMNDPNGFSVYQGKYHLFFQYHPYSTHWGPMHWGHVVSTDLVHWDYLPAAIAPDQAYDKSGCFSGSAIEMPDGKQLLIYTGVRTERQKNGVKRDFQTQCLAFGDGTNYEKYEGNPVISKDMIPVGFSVNDFRDPKIFRMSDGLYGVVVGNRTDDKSGAILLYVSEDAIHWRFATILDRCYNEYGRMWECPDLFELGETHVLAVSPQDMTQMGHEFHNGNGTVFILGSFDPETYTFTRNKVQAVDYGIDFYAPQTLLTPDGRRVMIGWMQNWDSCAPPEDAKWYGQMSIPRELSYRDGRVIQNPVRELETLHGRRVFYENVPVSDDELVLKGVYGRKADITVNIRPRDDTGYEMFRIKFAKGSQHYSSVSYVPKASTVRISRKHSGTNRDFVHDRRCFVRYRGGELKLRIILDRFSAEIFINDGEQAMSMTVYTPETADGVSFEAIGRALIDVEKYEILP